MSRPRRPPLAEVDTLWLAAAVRAGRWRAVGPWLALLAGFALVLAGLISFLWLSAQMEGHPEDRWLILLLAGGLGWFLWRRFAAQPGFALTLIAALGTLTVLAVLAWLALDAAVGGQVWVSLVGVLALAGLGIGIGLLGINRLGPPQV